MANRNLLYIELGERADTHLLEILSECWTVHKARNAFCAQQLIECESCQVGLVRFGDDREGRCQPELNDVLFSTPHIKWVAVLQRSALEHAKVREMISRNFYDYHHLPVDAALLQITLGHAHGKARLERYSSDDRAATRDRGMADGLIGSSAAIHTLRRQIDKIARVDTPVLITGESGTGKELAAQLIHRASRRASGPFVAVNCAALPANLIQAELFGHEKGSFTGAHKQKIGRFEAANGGTIFLDEIGDLPPEMQITLLRFLEQHTIERVGGLESIPVDVRVIAATNVDLLRAIGQERFREDLYYRLKVLHLRMPNLCERGRDLEVLANYFIDQFRDAASTQIQGLSRAAIKAMYSYRWPGNVRELMNNIRGALVMSDGPLLMPEDLGLERRSMRRNVRTLDEARATAEKAAILNAIENVSSNITQAANYLGISRGTLYRLMEKYAVNWPGKSPGKPAGMAGEEHDDWQSGPRPPRQSSVVLQY
jgi:DNA-binding NtrC family response regulator